MYFSNIANEELQNFHGIVNVDFSMSLTDILTSKLFKVETVIIGSIYRVYHFQDLTSCIVLLNHLENCNIYQV